MKKLFVLFLLACLVLSGCGARTDAQQVALIPAPPLSEYPLPTAEKLTQALSDRQLAVSTYERANSLETAVQQALSEGCGLFVVGLASPNEATSVINLLQPQGIPIVFYGTAPSASLSALYDKAWYIGANIEKQGELLGEALVEDYRAGRIPDKNADRLLQFAALDLDSELDKRGLATLRIFENHGIFSNELAFLQSARDEETAYIQVQQMLAQQGNSVELLLAATPELAAGAARAIAESGISVPLATFGENEKTQELLSSGALLNSAAYHTDIAVQMIAAFASNASEKKPITDGLSVYLSGNSIITDCILLAPAPDAVDTSTAAVSEE